MSGNEKLSPDLLLPGKPFMPDLLITQLDENRRLAAVGYEYTALAELNVR